MPRKTKRAHKKQTPTKKAKENPPPKARTHSVISKLNARLRAIVERLRRLKKRASWGGVLSLLGLLSALGFAFWPRVSIAVADPVDPPNRFSTAFTIANTGLVPLENVSAVVYLGEIAFGKFSINPPHSFRYDSKLAPQFWSGHRLSSDERFTITLTDILQYNSRDPEYFRGADIAIGVSYQVWKIPITLERQFRFTTKRQSDGQLYWYSSPMD
jgi:hypothetical protein